MRLGIIGLPGSGKSTIFQIIAQSKPEEGVKKGPFIITVQVPDKRVDALEELIGPKKTVYGNLEYLLPHGTNAYRDKKGDDSLWAEIRSCDALIHVVRNFRQPDTDAPHPKEDLLRLESEMIFADLLVVEKRIERINLDRKRGKDINDEEERLLKACLKVLEGEKSLRAYPELAFAPLLKGYALLSAKPVLIVFNNEEEDKSLPKWGAPSDLSNALVVRGKLEIELTELSSEEVAEFSSAYHVDTPATERVAQYSCNLLDLISFFTIVRNEVHCWLIRRGTSALDAAGVIHSDMKKGFIRAEVVSCDDLIAAGTYKQAKKEAKVHLEGKDYVVEDGDVIYFRFNL